MEKLLRGDACHEYLLKKRPLLQFDETADFMAWRQCMRETLSNVLGDMPQECQLNVAVEYEKHEDGYRKIRFTYAAEEFARVPAYLLVPDGNGPFPVALCLQGHTTGMHISMGEARFPGDDKWIPHYSHGLNAVRNGFAALVIEQRGMGERVSEVTKDDHFAAHTALLVGRTLIGERVWDISRGIDALGYFAGQNLDVRRLACVGNSGGGTASYYAAAVDKRIGLTVASCSVCSYADSIGAMYHCICNYLPGAAKYFDMGEVSALIAPRGLIVVAGENDPIFPIAGVRKVYDTIEQIYKICGVPNKCRLIVNDGGHDFKGDAVWKIAACAI